LQGLNLFWLYYILRIAYRFVFLDALDDDRSDNDENEYKQEQAEEAITKQKQAVVDAASNGTANSSLKAANGKTTSADNYKDKVTNRKPNGKKA
jgi:acyl-CoA-dependent ceramide synthase